MTDIENCSVLRHILPAQAGAAAAADLKKSLEAGRTLMIDASAVEHLSIFSIQLIAAAARSGLPVFIETASANFISAFDALGLQCPPAASATEVAPEKPQSEIAQPTRVLTIDDSKTIRQMLMLTLDQAGYEVRQANDGQEGVDALQHETFDLVITDINMPRMDGYGVIRAMRADPKHRKTPILVLTTESESDKKNLARELGATGWIVKPFDPVRLIETVRKVAA
jgi:two-component system chemotaxis response regulator CheY